MEADLVVTGNIFTGEGTLEEALAVKGGRIVYVGNWAGVQPYIGGQTDVRVVTDGMVLPGMTEGHAHVTSTYEILNYAPLYQGESVEDYVRIFRQYQREHPQEEVLMGRGYKNGVFGAAGPNAAVLDQVSTELPVVAIGEDAHSVWINTKAMELIGLDKTNREVPHGEIVRASDGQPTGWLKEAADGLVRPILPPLECEKVKEAILHYQKLAMANGITHVFEPMLNLQRDYETCLRAYRELAEENRLLLCFQVGYMLYPGGDIDEGIRRAVQYRREAQAAGSSRFSMNTIKLFIDGVLEGHTAYLKQPYADDGSMGEPFWTQERCREAVCKASEQGFQVHIHTIGDGALEIAIEAFRAAAGIKETNVGSQAARAGARSVLPHAVTHVQVVSEHQFEQLAELGVAVVVNPYWHTRDELYFEQIEKPYLGAERAEREYPVASFLRAGCLVAQASDFPVTIPADVMMGLHIMVNRGEPMCGTSEPLNRKEALSVEEALTVLTLNGAKQGGLEASMGSIRVGKDADFVILDKNLLTIPPSQLYTARVKNIFIQGKSYEMEELV